MFYKMLFDRFVDFAYLYTVLDMPRQIRIVCLHNVPVLCFVNNGLADKTSTEPGLPSDPLNGFGRGNEGKKIGRGRDGEKGRVGDGKSKEGMRPGEE